MRTRQQILASLEKAFKEAFDRAQEADDRAEMERLDLEYQQEQLRLEVFLDIRELLRPVDEPPGEPVDRAASLIERAEQLRRITRLR